MFFTFYMKYKVILCGYPLQKQLFGGGFCDAILTFSQMSTDHSGQNCIGLFLKWGLITGSLNQ